MIVESCEHFKENVPGYDGWCLECISNLIKNHEERKTFDYGQVNDLQKERDQVIHHQMEMVQEIATKNKVIDILKENYRNLLERIQMVSGSARVT